MKVTLSLSSDAEAAEEVAAAVELIEAGVPAERPAAVERRAFVAGVGGERTGVGERLAVEDRVGVGVEEVAGGGDHFVAHRREEVTDLHRQVVVGDFAVELRHGEAV